MIWFSGSHESGDEKAVEQFYMQSPTTRKEKGQSPARKTLQGFAHKPLKVVISDRKLRKSQDGQMRSNSDEPIVQANIAYHPNNFQNNQQSAQLLHSADRYSAVQNSNLTRRNPEMSVYQRQRQQQQYPPAMQVSNLIDTQGQLSAKALAFLEPNGHSLQP